MFYEYKCIWIDAVIVDSCTQPLRSRTVLIHEEFITFMCYFTSFYLTYLYYFENISKHNHALFRYVYNPVERLFSWLHPCGCIYEAT
jgi:hypothetical protein